MTSSACMSADFLYSPLSIKGHYVYMLQTISFVFLSQTGVVFNSLAISVFVLESVQVYSAVFLIHK